MATDILITVIVYNTSPPRVSYSALALACRWVQNRLFDSDTRFMMAAKRQVRYTCTVRLVRDRKFGDWIKPLRVRWSSFISAFLFFVFLDPVRSLRQSMSLMTCSTSHRQRGVRLLLLVAGAVLVGGWSCTCWWLELYLLVAGAVLVGGWSCTCWWLELYLRVLYCASLEPFLVFCFFVCFVCFVFLFFCLFFCFCFFCFSILWCTLWKL